MALVEHQNIMHLDEPGLENEDVCGFKAHVLVEGVAKAGSAKGTRIECIWHGWCPWECKCSGLCVNVIVGDMEG